MRNAVMEYCASQRCNDCKIMRICADIHDWRFCSDTCIEAAYKLIANNNKPKEEKENNTMPQNTNTSTNTQDRFQTITDYMHSVYLAKNADYGSSFSETFQKLGLISAVTRLSDKTNRLVSLATKKDVKVKDEKIEDTLLDMANYAILTLIELGFRPDDKSKN
jgi:hypothetical protein